MHIFICTFLFEINSVSLYENKSKFRLKSASSLSVYGLDLAKCRKKPQLIECVQVGKLTGTHYLCCAKFMQECKNVVLPHLVCMHGILGKSVNHNVLIN